MPLPRSCLAGEQLETMDLNKTIDELRAELKRINATIATLEEMARGGRRKPGRPKGSKNKPRTPAESNLLSHAP